MKKTFFIADLHLNKTTPKITDLFLNFLQKEATQAEELYILGDLFVIWTGDDDSRVLATTIKTALKKLATNGVKIFLIPGNRDFLLGEEFAKSSDCTLLPDPTIINLYGKRTLLTHGDLLCGKDSLYKKFRFLTRNKKHQKFFLKLPFFFRNSLAYFIHTLSSMRNATRSRKEMKKIVQKEAIAITQKHKAEQIIHGHIHLPFIEEIRQDDIILRHIVVGAWDNENSSILIYYENGGCQITNNKDAS